MRLNLNRVHPNYTRFLCARVALWAGWGEWPRRRRFWRYACGEIGIIRPALARGFLGRLRRSFL